MPEDKLCPITKSSCVGKDCKWWDKDYKDCKVSVMLDRIALSFELNQKLFDELAVISRKKTRGIVKWVLKTVGWSLDKFIADLEKAEKEK